tara:strand:- start:799 stop:1605 length:807 start_codon:yes stop_codon:yes gene_type:complete
MNGLILETSSDSNTGSITSTTDSVPLLTLKNTNTDGNSAAVLQMKSHPSDNVQADTDEIGLISFVGVDDAGATAEYGAIICSAPDTDASGEEGKLSINLATAGARTEVMSITAGTTQALSTVAIPGILTQHKKTITTGAFTTNRLNIGTTASGSIVTVPTTGDASDIGLPVISAGLAGWHVTLVCAADNGAHTITLRQGGAADGSGTLANTPFFGILMDDGANSLVGTTSAVIAASKFKKGDHIDLICDGTNYIIKVHAVTAAAVTVS